MGKDEKDQIKQFQIEGVMLDIITAFIRVAWNPEDTESKKESLNLKFSQINEFYGEKEFAFGYLTLIDFRIAEFANWVEKLYPEEFAKYPVFQRTREAFNNLPEIKEYYSSEKAVKGPFLPSSAKVSF